MSFTKFNSIAKERHNFMFLLSKGLQRELKLMMPDSKSTQLQKALNQSELQHCIVPFFTTSKKGLEEHMKQRIVRKVCMESSSRATERLTVNYLQYALLANVNHNDLGPTTMSNNEKYYSASSVCYR